MKLLRLLTLLAAAGSLQGCYIVEHVRQEDAEYARLRKAREEQATAQAQANAGRPRAPAPAVVDTSQLDALIKDYQWRTERWFLTYGENRGGSASTEAIRLIGFITDDLRGIDEALERLLKTPKLEPRLREQFLRQKAHYREQGVGWGKLAQPWRTWD